MQSLSDLNNYGAQTIDVTDDRAAQIIFTNSAGDVEYTTTEGKVIYFKDIIGVEIEDIVDYANVNMEVDIELTVPFPDNPTVVYTDKPSYMTVSTVGAVTTISGFRSIADWLWLKNKFGLQNATNWFGDFDLDIDVRSDTNTTESYTASVTVLDIGLLDAQADYQYTFTAIPSLQDASDFIAFDDPGSSPADSYTITLTFDEGYKFNIENVMSTSSASGGLTYDNNTKTVTINADREDTKEILENLQMQIANQFDIPYEISATNNDSGETDYEAGFQLYSTVDTSLLADPVTQLHDGTSFTNTGLPQITDTTVTTADYTYQINTLGNIDSIEYPNLNTEMTWTRNKIIDLTSGQTTPDYERFFDIDVSEDGNTIAVTPISTGTDSTIVNERSIKIYELIAGTWTITFEHNPVVDEVTATGNARLSRDGTVALHTLSDGSFDYFFKTNEIWEYSGNYNPPSVAAPGPFIDMNENGLKVLFGTAGGQMLEYSNGAWSEHSTLPDSATGANVIQISNDGNRILETVDGGNSQSWKLYQWSGSSWSVIASDSFTYAATGITWTTVMNNIGDTVVTLKSEVGLSVYYEDDSWAEEIIEVGDTIGTSYAHDCLYINNLGNQIVHSNNATNQSYTMRLWNESTGVWDTGNAPPLFQSAGNISGEQAVLLVPSDSNRASNDGQSFYVIANDIIGADFYIYEVRTPITINSKVDGVYTLVAPKSTINNLITNAEMEVNSSVTNSDFVLNIQLETPSAGRTGKAQDVERT